MKLGFDKNNKQLLEQYIKGLIKENKIYKFYKTDEWKQLRDEMLFINHNECVMCRNKGVITKADCVHHVQYVKKYPKLALSKTYVDNKGQRQVNLLPLCNSCHEKLHKRCTFGNDNYNMNNSNKKILNSEKW